MKTIIVFCFIFSTAFSSRAAADLLSADPRDRAVLQTVLTNLLSNPQVALFLKKKNPHTELVFVSRTPRILLPPKDEIQKEVRKVLGGEFQNLVSRNSKDRKPKQASFDGIKLSPKFILVDSDEMNDENFETKYPNARGWIQAWLPGYSDDGTHAIVRARKGVAPFGAAVTASLDKKGEEWSIAWIKIAYWSGK
jgi:hypothetical protein